ncbi:MAG: SMC-Scp complex subunit ScpB [Candidatus Omnitrophota bacterium]
MEIQDLKGIIEALIFSSEKPLTMKEIKQVVEESDNEKINQAVSELKSGLDNAKSGIQIVEVAGGYQMVTRADYSLYLKKFYKQKHIDKLSIQALETLAIIAYKQPLTKAEIEALRGVNIDGVLKTIFDKGLVRIIGRKDIPGRPFVYGTSKFFLEYFGLKSLEDLPKIEEFVSNAQKDCNHENAKISTAEVAEI